MKKWKQTFWVQYGPHTMLWFRSESDFSDWLNNPYHDQAQRNFLIKLAVNFVHDLYKPNVRGYQVTQCRTKAYGNKMIRQFKLERWMDYGPTIAAAFGSYNPREVDDLRLALVECMRNTPLNSGIRATGAVRQQQQQQHLQIEDRPRGGTLISLLVMVSIVYFYSLTTAQYAPPVCSHSSFSLFLLFLFSFLQRKAWKGAMMEILRGIDRILRICLLMRARTDKALPLPNRTACRKKQICSMLITGMMFLNFLPHNNSRW